MIVLLWNVAVTARDARVGAAIDPCAFRGEPAGAPGGAQLAEADGVFGAGATGGRTGPLSVRQRFLLGRKVDVNNAGWKEISGLPGISDGVARAVVEERGRAGGFRRPEDLLAVRGIKEKRLKKILPFLSGFANN